MAELWLDPIFRQFLMGLVAMVIISVAKKYSDYANTNAAFKYCAVSVLAVIAALFSQLAASPNIEFGQLAGDVVKIAAASIFGYQTLGKAARALLETYTNEEK
jgi:hypothetical protein